MIVNKHLITIISNILSRARISSGKLSEISDKLETSNNMVSESCSGFINTGKCIIDDNGNRISWLFYDGTDEHYYKDTGSDRGFVLLSDLTESYSINDCESNYSHKIYSVDVGNSPADADLDGNYDGADLFPASVDPSVLFIDILVTNMDGNVDMTNWIPNNIKDGCRVTIQKQSTDGVHTITGDINDVTYVISATNYNFFVIQWSETDNKFYIAEI